MPTKHNKKRYQSTPKPTKLLTLTGVVFLMYREEEIDPKPGDLILFPSCDELHTLRMGDYGNTGVSGYFKADIYDGKDWCPLLINDFFPDREHHFSKYERPIDTFALCEEKFIACKGTQVKRTYREHYTLAGE